MGNVVLISESQFVRLFESTNNGKYHQRTRNVFVNNGHVSMDDAHKWEERFRKEFMGGVHQTVMRLEPVFANIAIEEGYLSGSVNGRIGRLKKLVQYINKLSLDLKQSGRQLPLNSMTIDNTTFETLESQFGEAMDNMSARSSNGHYIPDMDQYVIIKGITFEDAKEYGYYSGDESGDLLCYTQDEDIWMGFTNNGVYNVSLIVREDFYNIEPVHGKNTPYDEYGLSMVFVFFDNDGNLMHSNTRWNHSFDEEAVGNRMRDFDFTDDDLYNIFGLTVEDLMPEDENGISDQEMARIMDAYKRGETTNVKLGDVIGINFGDNAILVNTEGEPLTKTVFSKVRIDNRFPDVITVHTKSALLNYMKPNGKFLFDRFFSCEDKIGYGLIVDYGGSKNVLYRNENGHTSMMFDRWLEKIESAGPYHHIAKFSPHQYAVLKDDFSAISDKYSSIVTGSCDLFIVLNDEMKANFMDEELDIIGDVWFDRMIFDFTDSPNEDLCVIQNEGQYAVMNLFGELMTDWVPDYKKLRYMIENDEI